MIGPLTGQGVGAVKKIAIFVYIQRVLTLGINPKVAQNILGIKIIIIRLYPLSFLSC